MLRHIKMPSSEDSAAHNPSRVSIDNGRLQETHKFSTVKHEITAKNMYTHIHIGVQNCMLKCSMMMISKQWSRWWFSPLNFLVSIFLIATDKMNWTLDTQYVMTFHWNTQGWLFHISIWFVFSSVALFYWEKDQLQV